MMAPSPYEIRNRSPTETATFMAWVTVRSVNAWGGARGGMGATSH